MAQILFFVPANLAFHANLPSDKRQQLIKDLPLWLQAFENSGLPILMSMQGIDAALAGIDLQSFGLDWCHAPYGHLLPSMFEDTDWDEHVAWNFGAGAFPYHNTDITFSPEFDIPGYTAVTLPPTTFLSLAHPTTVTCTESHQRGPKLNERGAYLYEGSHVVVPMAGTWELIKYFQAYQLTMDKAHLQLFILTLKRLGDEPGDLPFVFFMDFEAPLIGSHHGLKVWEDIFEAIDKAEIRQVFLKAADANQLWRSHAAAKAIDDSLYFCRDIGSKWTALRPQLSFMHRVLENRIPENDTEHRAASLFTQSDIYAALDNCLRRDINLPSDQGTLNIGFDQAVINATYRALHGWERNDVAGALRLDDDDEVNDWYYKALANAIERP